MLEASHWGKGKERSKLHEKKNSSFNKKFTRHAKKQRPMIHTLGEKQATEATSEINQIWDLIDKDFKVVEEQKTRRFKNKK